MQVPIIQLSDWIKREVAGRVIPRTLHGKGEALIPPRIVMKLDIEMMEYEVFPDLMLSGALCENIHAMIGEFHLAGGIAWLWPKDGMAFGTNGNVWNLPREEARKISTEWLRMMEHNPNCVTKFSMEDDETYRNDGQPLPILVPQNDTASSTANQS